MLERWKDKAIVVNLLTGKHFSTMPVSLTVAKSQIKKLDEYDNTKGLKRKDKPKPF